MQREYDDGYSVGTKLYLKDEDLVSYNKHAFNGADKRGVTRIDLAENKLTHLTENAFQGFDQVTVCSFICVAYQ